ncbi:hypothetical protein BO80DRAFT_447665 [Aspergillus terreus]|uniref:Uncharacterized protein n=1 Tax=Aspergillus terreus TaxID=33178 RepID=A0A5M3Z3J3_ASPTE|nr:hypothetical protein ATETN484_0006057300 [Aspergillus terreus]GFF20169.1 hypothetical protein BO80DRAFT_447665 [Aspergillus terreus]
MVSQAQIVDRSAAMMPSAPPSSVSRHSHSSRRHRSSRSHHGGLAHQSQNDFPVFTHTGDVEIIIRAGSQEKRYLLHRLILAQCSGFFEASTQEEWSRQPPSRPSNHGPPDLAVLSRISEDNSSLSNGSTLAQSENGFGGLPLPPEKKRWRYELDWDSKAEDEEPMLVQKPPSFTVGLDPPGQYPPSMTKPSSTQTGLVRSMANLAGMQSAVHLPRATSTATNEPLDPIIRDYDNLLRLFYNYPPALNSVNIATAYAECRALLALADMYDALAVTGPRVDHHLLGFGSRLFKQIAKYPPSYLKLGYLARSRVIYSEALIHVVGQWPTALPHLRNGPYASPLPTAVLDIIEDKVEDLEDLKARVDSKLLRLTLTTSRGERVSPTNAYLDWLAVSLFRQWFVDSTTPPPPPILKNGAPTSAAANSHHHSSSAGGSSGKPADSHSSRAPPSMAPPLSSAQVYRLIGSSSSQAYLPREELKRFLKVHPTPSSEALYTRDVLKRFERKMDEIKRLAREIVKPLMRNFLELDLKSGGGDVAGDTGLPYLTCIKVEDIDIPWS